MLLPNPQSWTAYPTQDGSATFYSPEFKEYFHSLDGAKAEAMDKFVGGTGLAETAQAGPVRILDVCYGLGYNTAAALTTIAPLLAPDPDAYPVEIIALELDITVPQAALEPQYLDLWPVPVQIVLRSLAVHQRYQDDRCQAQLLVGDARQTLPPLVRQGWQADVIFLDPFSPRHCPQLWTLEFLGWLIQALSPQGTLVTYSRAAAVRSVLQQGGLVLGTLPPVAGRSAQQWSGGTIARADGTGLQPLSAMEQEHLHTRAAIPYRDPSLEDAAPTILQRRVAEQGRSPLEGNNEWRKRWNLH